jgi:DNA-binding NtrC family response regulator
MASPIQRKNIYCDIGFFWSYRKVIKFKRIFMHVLIITDRDTDLNWIDNSFVATGLAVNSIKAHNIVDATELMRSVKFDMVLYDLAFSQDSMTENLQQLTAEGYKMPLVVLTNKQGDPVAKEALKFGAIYHFVKDQFKLAVMAESFKTMLLKDTLSYN